MNHEQALGSDHRPRATWPEEAQDEAEQALAAIEQKHVPIH